MERSWVLSHTTLMHRLRVRNYAGSPLQIPLEFFLGADFADIFEVGESNVSITVADCSAELGKNTVRFSYKGLDGVRRFTEIAFDTMPQALGGDRAAS